MYKTYLGFFDNGLDIIVILVVLISAVYSSGSSLRVVIGLLPCQEVAFHGLDIEFVLGQLFGLLLPLPLFAFSLCPCHFLLCLGLSSFLLVSAMSSSLCFVNTDSSSEMVDSQSSWTKFKMSACSGWAFMVQLSLA